MNTQSAPVENTSFWMNHGRLLVLLTTMLICGLWVYWYRYDQPNRLFEQAKQTAKQNPRRAEELVATAINQSSVNLPEAEFLRVRLLGQLGKWEESLGQFSLIKHPELLPAKELCTFASFAQQQGAFLLAEKIFRTASHDSKLLPQILQSLIKLHLQLGQEARAQSECQELLKLTPNDATAWQILGTVSMNQSDLVLSEQAFRKCLEYSNDAQQKTLVYEDLIQVLIDIGNLPQARSELENLRKISTNLTDRALIEEAWILRMEGKPLNGIEIINPLIANNSKLLLKAYLLRGLMHSDAEQKEAAISDLEIVVAKQPWNKEAHHKISVVYTQMKKPEKATLHRSIADKLTDQSLELLNLKDQLSNNPNDVSLRKRVAELYRILGQPEKAKKTLSIKS